MSTRLSPLPYPSNKSRFQVSALRLISSASGSDWKPSGNLNSLNSGFASRLAILYGRKTSMISTTGFQQVSKSAEALF
jgi:hypothetical protein